MVSSLLMSKLQHCYSSLTIRIKGHHRHCCLQFRGQVSERGLPGTPTKVAALIPKHSLSALPHHSPVDALTALPPYNPLSIENTGSREDKTVGLFFFFLNRSILSLISVWVNIHVCAQVPKGAREGVRSPGARVTGKLSVLSPSSVGAADQTQELCK